MAFTSRRQKSEVPMHLCQKFADDRRRKTRLIVAAIDFGTTYSGYAYSFRDEYKTDPFTIYANADWSDGSGLMTSKAPTVVLFDKAKRFDSFGYDAETNYNDLALENKHKGWRYFRRFKMTLFRKKAGIPGDQLTLAYEPEAAAVYCKEIKIALLTEKGEAAELKSFCAGSKYMVIDLGGGTTDITSHEVQHDGKLASLAAPSGGLWGGTLVDKKFDNLFVSLFGKDVMDRFSKECKVDKLDLDRTIELKKREIKSTSDKVHIKIPNDIFVLYKKLKKKEFDNSLLGSNLRQTVSKIKDRLLVANTIFLDMFKESKEKVINHVEAQLRHTDLRNVKTIMMVGGFSESEVMNNAIKERFKDKGYQVIVPERAGLAVVKGAVMYGHNPDSICSRKMPFTYGISVAVPFDDNKHSEEHTFRRTDGTKMCEDILHKFIVKGDRVVPGKTSAEHTFNSTITCNGRVTIEVYKSEDDNPPMYSTDCRRVGELVLQKRSCQIDQTALINVKMMFGGTKVTVEAHEQGAVEMNKVQAEFDWLKD